ncbi:MAG: tetratricopeptide repeat protein [Treponema sp.]|nr:tetratricopeptide repeat protein [Treponema sp.]
MKKKCTKKSILILFLSLFMVFCAFAENINFTKGEEFFRQNEPAKAIPLLEKAITEGGNPRAYIYLALAYYQLEQYPAALEVCNKGMLATGTNKKILAYDAGNICFKMEDYENAEKWYTMAITADSTYAPAVLNRAQSRLKLARYADSREDYIRYQELAPTNPQYQEIQLLIALLDTEVERIAKEEEAAKAEAQRIQIENARIEAENARIEAARVEAERVAAEKAAAEKEAEEARARAKQAEEEARIAAEKAAEAERKEKEEAERRRRLLEDVAASLQDSETQNMSAGAEGTVDYGYESELE